MVTLRCTQKLLTRLRKPPVKEVPPATTVLGDWYATLLFTRPDQIVLCLNEKTLLAVIIQLRPSKTLDERFRESVAGILNRIGIPQEQVEKEIKEMEQAGFAKTADRGIVGCLKSASEFVMWSPEPDQVIIPQVLEDKLSKYLYTTIDYKHPDDLAGALFRGGN